MSLFLAVQQVYRTAERHTAQQPASPKPGATSVTEEALVPCCSCQASKLAHRSETSPSPHAVVPCDAALDAPSRPVTLPPVASDAALEAPSRPVTLPLVASDAEPIATEQTNPQSNTRDIGIITGVLRLELKPTFRVQVYFSISLEKLSMWYIFIHTYFLMNKYQTLHFKNQKKNCRQGTKYENLLNKLMMMLRLFYDAKTLLTRVNVLGSILLEEISVSQCPIGPNSHLLC